MNKAIERRAAEPTGLSERTEGEGIPILLDNYAQMGRMFLLNAAQNLIQFGRVLIEAKPLIPRGQFENWVKENFKISERTAQGYMAVYRRFGEQEGFRQLQFSKLQEMLALPEGTEGQFAEKHDLEDMSAREIKRAVQQVKTEAQAEIDRERAARKSAEKRVQELENEAGKVPDHIMDSLVDKQNTIDQQRRELERVTADGREALKEAQRLRRELDENAELLEETQEECNRAQAELLNLQSAVAKGDAERMPSDELTVDAFASAVRQFVGTCARMPHMGRRFAVMHLTERNAYDELLRTVEGWAKDARNAMNTIACEEVEIHDS